jgi:PhnB protein
MKARDVLQLAHVGRLIYTRRGSMTSNVKPIPDGYHTVTPYLIVRDAATLMEFLKRAFDAQESLRMPRPDGTIQHAEAKIGDSVVMLAEASDEWKPTSASIHLYLPDTDAAYQRALQAGATSLRAPADQPYGDRSAGVQDASGTIWWLATHIQDVSPHSDTR